MLICTEFWITLILPSTPAFISTHPSDNILIRCLMSLLYASIVIRVKFLFVNQHLLCQRIHENKTMITQHEFLL